MVGLAVALAALLVGCGGFGGGQGGGEQSATASAAHYTDAVGDGGAAPDIRAIDVMSASDGRITFRVTLGQLEDSHARTGVDLWLDTDGDPETGNTTFEDAGGAEYLVSTFPGFELPGNRFCGLISAGSGCIGLYTPNGWIAASAPTARVARTVSGVTISIKRSDLGDTNDLNFYAVGWTEGVDSSDRAPGTGTSNYSLALGGPRTKASSSSGETSDKAGGEPDEGPVALTLATRDYNVIEASEFASAVERLSGGSIRIDVKHGVRFYDIDYEQSTIVDVQNDVYDLALVGARAWDAAGVKSFNALVAPFLVDTYAIQRHALESSIAERMLDGVEPLGLVGIALLPGELRRPLGLSRALIRPADYRRARIGIRPAGVASATFAALGARAEGFRAMPEGLAGFDGAESGASTIQNNRYDKGARALTANVVLWPRPTTIIMNRAAFDALTGDQRQALRQAGLEAIEPVLTAIQDAEQASLEAICTGSRLTLVKAVAGRSLRSSPSRPAGLRGARARPADGEARRGDRGPARQRQCGEPSRCVVQAPVQRSDSSALDGAWRVDVTREELRAAGAQLEQFERAEGSWTVEFGDGRWVARNLESGNLYRGTYALDGNVVRETVRSCAPTNICTPGGVEEYGWSVFRDRLDAHADPGSSVQRGRDREAAHARSLARFISVRRLTRVR